MKALYGYSSHPVTWTEEIKQHFYPTQSTRSTPAINSKALWSIARVDRVNYVGLICNLLPYSPFVGHLPQHICLKIFWGFDKGPRWAAPPLAQVICYCLQSGTLWRIETSVIRWPWPGQLPHQHTERHSCKSTDNPAQALSICWLENLWGCQRLLKISGGKR